MAADALLDPRDQCRLDRADGLQGIVLPPLIVRASVACQEHTSPKHEFVDGRFCGVAAIVAVRHRQEDTRLAKRKRGCVFVGIGMRIALLEATL
jgi:hypothetical protein